MPAAAMPMLRLMHFPRAYAVRQAPSCLFRRAAAEAGAPHSGRNHGRFRNLAPHDGGRADPNRRCHRPAADLGAARCRTRALRPAGTGRNCLSRSRSSGRRRLPPAAEADGAGEDAAGARPVRGLARAGCRLRHRLRGRDHGGSWRLGRRPGGRIGAGRAGPARIWPDSPTSPWSRANWPMVTPLAGPMTRFLWRARSTWSRKRCAGNCPRAAS